MPHPSEHNIKLHELKQKVVAADPIEAVRSLTPVQQAVVNNIPVIRAHIDRSFADRCTAHSAAARARILGR